MFLRPFSLKNLILIGIPEFRCLTVKMLKWSQGGGGVVYRYNFRYPTPPPCLELFLSSDIKQFIINRNIKQSCVTPLTLRMPSFECVRSCTQHKQQEKIWLSRRVGSLLTAGSCLLPSQFLVLSFIVCVIVLLTYFTIEKYYHTYFLS